MEESKGTGEKLNWVAREGISHKYPLSDEEKLGLAEKMAAARIEISKLESRLSEIKKEYKEKIDAEMGELSSAAFQFQSGLGEVVEVECDVFQAFDTQEMVYRRADDGVEIRRRPMLDNEKMPTLFSLMNEPYTRIQFPDKK